MSLIDDDQWVGKINTRMNLLAELAQQAPQQQKEALEATIEQLQTALEELHVAQEELSTQNNELVEARNQLDEERRNYLELFDFAPDGYIVTDENGSILDINRTAEAMLGVRRKTAVGKPLITRVAMEDRRRLRELLTHHRDHPHPSRIELGIIPAEGDAFDAEVSLSPFQSRHGHYGIRWLLRDVTERKQAELQLHLDEQRLAEAQAIAHVGSWYLDDASGTLSCSAEMKRILGVPPANTRELTSLSSLVEHIHSDDRTLLRRFIQTARALHSPSAFECRAAQADGTYRTVQLRAEVLQESPGQVSALVGSIRDVTEDREAEERIKHQNAELERRVNERTAELSRTNDDLRVEIDRRVHIENRLQESLERTTELYKASRTIAMARNPDDVLIALMASPRLTAALVSSIMLFDRPWHDEALPETVSLYRYWTRRSGLTRHIDQNAYFALNAVPGARDLLRRDEPTVITDIEADQRLDETLRGLFLRAKCRGAILLPLVAAGTWYGVLTLHFSAPEMTGSESVNHIRGLVDQVAMAVYNQRLLESESRARQEAERANEARLRFLAMISHELRTPLASIKGFATTLMAGDVSWEAQDQLDFISIINAEADKLTELIDQLLDLSRLEAGLLEIRPILTSVDAIFVSVRSQLEHLANRHKLEIELPQDLPPVNADIRRISQVLSNLVDNAAKYSPPETCITVNAEAQPEGICVNVIDRGKGVPPQDRERIFQVFHRGDTEATSRVRGAGLGLAICKGLVEAHGGRIWIRDGSDPGTTVSFTLPRAQMADG